MNKLGQSKEIQMKIDNISAHVEFQFCQIDDTKHVVQILPFKVYYIFKFSIPSGECC